MNKKTAIAIISISFAFLPMALVGSTFATWAVTDNANPFGFKINIEGQTLEEGHYLYWDGADEGVKLDRTATGESGYYSYSIPMSAGMTGSSKKFVIKDELDTVIVNESAGLTINFTGEYTLTNSNAGYSLTYPLYFKDISGSSTWYAYLYDGVGGASNGEYPGAAMSRIGETNEFKLNIDAKKFANTDAKVIFNNNSTTDKTDNTALSGLVAGTTGYTNSTTRVYLAHGGGVDWWISNDATTVAYVFGDGKTSKWYKMTDSATGQVGVTITDDLSGYDGVIFARCDKNSITTDSGTGFPSCWNQTVNLSLSVGRINDFTFNGKGGNTSKEANKSLSLYSANTYNHVNCNLKN